MRNIIICIIIISTSLQSTENKNSKKFNLSICSNFKNESKFFKEWIEYHRLAGVDHFYLYNISSTDRYLDVLKPYIKKGWVTLIQWPDLSRNIQNVEIWALGSQIPAYENAVRYRALKETKWLVFVDVDEFLVPPLDCGLVEVLEKYKEFPGIVLSSETYDASSSLNKKKLLIETLELSNPPIKVLERSVEKTIFKPELVDWFTWPPYRFVFKEGQNPMTIGKYELRINHYVNRKLGSLHPQRNRIKMEINPVQFSEDELSELLKAGYEIEDRERAIYRFVPELLKKMSY